MSNFAIWISGSWTTPPADARPVAIGDPVFPYGPVVMRNSPAARSGLGYPVGVDDELFAVVGRSSINSTGMAWWYTTTGIGTSASADIAVRLWNPVTQAWTDYSGIMYAPEYNMAQAGYKVTDFRVQFRRLLAI